MYHHRALHMHDLQRHYGQLCPCMCPGNSLVATSLLEHVQHEGALMTQVLCDACLFDASSLTWRLKEPTPFARCAHTAVALPSGALLLLLAAYHICICPTSLLPKKQSRLFLLYSGLLLAVHELTHPRRQGTQSQSRLAVLMGLSS